ncbi:MAG: immunoglobulin domain-containing protein, partial [Phycisphaerales bacterium]|nr:immunoglobulin domain-containing protein [Phycisphaerales bacterium]
IDAVRNAVVLFGGVGADGQVRSDTWVLLYGPRITQQPTGATACVGQGVTLSAAADAAGLGGTLSYQWVHDGAPIDPSQNPSAQTPTLTLSPFTADDAGEYACVVTASFTDAAGTACVAVSTAAARVSTPPADVGSQGGVPGPDGQFDNNDFIVFINGFFAQEGFADLGVQGGVPGSDGLFDNNDFIAFITAFFAPCG